MIGRLLTYPYGNARSRALATRLLPPEELEELTESGSATQAAVQLEGRLPPETGPISIEHRLQADYLAWGRLLLPTLPEPAQILLRAYLQRSWVENLQALCRCLLGHPPAGNLPPPLPVFDPLVLPLPGEVRDLQELAAQLPPGPYREVLQPLAGASGTVPSARVENRLVMAFWSAVTAACARLPALDALAAREILGLRADIDALRILLRGQEAELDGKGILALWPSPSRFLDSGRLRRVLRSDEPIAGLRSLLHRAVGVAGSGGQLEMALRRRLRRQLRRGLLSAPFDITVPLCALLLKELEVMDLQGILAGLRFGFGPEALRPMVSSLEG